jgi:hypothetical protein
MNLYRVDGSLAVAAHPRGGPYLADEMSHLHREGVGVLVSCLMPSEETELGLVGEREAAFTAGLAFV